MLNYTENKEISPLIYEFIFILLQLKTSSHTITITIIYSFITGSCSKSISYGIQVDTFPIHCTCTRRRDSFNIFIYYELPLSSCLLFVLMHTNKWLSPPSFDQTWYIFFDTKKIGMRGKWSCLSINDVKTKHIRYTWTLLFL